MRFSFNLLAERELNDAAHYYERESPGLGTAFLDDVERILAVMNLKRRPNYWTGRDLKRTEVVVRHPEPCNLREWHVGTGRRARLRAEPL